MKFSKIETIKDVKSLSHDSFSDILNKEILLYIDSMSVVRVLDLKSFSLIFEKTLNFFPFIHFCGGRIYLRYPDDTLYYLDYQNGSIDLFYQVLKEDDFEASVGLISESLLLESHSKFENYNPTALFA